MIVILKIRVPSITIISVRNRAIWRKLPSIIVSTFIYIGYSVFTFISYPSIWHVNSSILISIVPSPRTIEGKTITPVTLCYRRLYLKRVADFASVLSPCGEMVELMSVSSLFLIVKVISNRDENLELVHWTSNEQRIPRIAYVLFLTTFVGVDCNGKIYVLLKSVKGRIAQNNGYTLTTVTHFNFENHNYIRIEHYRMKVFFSFQVEPIDFLLEPHGNYICENGWIRVMSEKREKIITVRVLLHSKAIRGIKHFELYYGLIVWAA